MFRLLTYNLLLYASVFIVLLFGLRYLITRPVTCIPDCIGMNLIGRDLSGLNLAKTNFVEAQLQGVDLNGVNLYEADLSGANLTGANLRNANLNDAKLIGANLSRADLGGSSLFGANLSGANLTEADLTKVDLTETTLSGASFAKARLTDANLQNANLAGIEFTEANLTGANLQQVSLSGGSLSRADLSGAQLMTADLTGAWLNLTNLTGANLSNADLAGSRLIGAQLTSSNLTGAHLQGAVAIGANLDGANLRGADLRNLITTALQVNRDDFKRDPLLAELTDTQENALIRDANLNGVEYGLMSITATQVIAQTSLPEPQRVKVNFFVNSISDINATAGAYTIDFYVDFFWKEPTLTGKDIHTVDPTRLFNPEVTVVNSRNVQVLSTHYDNSHEPGTNVRFTRRLVGVFFHPFDLRSFPFDQQNFVILLESVNFDSDDLLLEFVGVRQPDVQSEKPYTQSVPQGRYIDTEGLSAEWAIQSTQVSQQIHVYMNNRSSRSQLRIEFAAQRQATLYLWRTMFVLMLLVIFCGCVLLIQSQMLHYRLWFLFTLFLTTIAFNALTTKIMPRLAYLTFLDKYLFICYAAIVVTSIVVILTKTLHEKALHRWAEGLNRGYLLLYGAFCIILNLGLIWRI